MLGTLGAVGTTFCPCSLGPTTVARIRGFMITEFSSIEPIDSTWMGDCLGILGTVGTTFCHWSLSTTTAARIRGIQITEFSSSESWMGDCMLGTLCAVGLAQLVQLLQRGLEEFRSLSSAALILDSTSMGDCMLGTLGAVGTTFCPCIGHLVQLLQRGLEEFKSLSSAALSL
jgi:hypothetical protein